MGDPDQPHSYSYTPDVAAALITLGTPAGRHRLGLAPPRSARPGPPGRSSSRSTRSPDAARAASPPGGTPCAFGLIKPPMREYLHTLYQFTNPWVVDDTKYRTAFGGPTTPLDDALAATLEWYRDPRTTPFRPAPHTRPHRGAHHEHPDHRPTSPPRP